MTFVGRAHELALLEREHAAERASFVPIYGRRRVGKSELILRFLEDHSGIYYVGKQAPAGLQVREFLREAAVACDEPLLGELSIDSWAAALERVTDAWRRPEKLVIVLDELQWIASASPELPSVLQELWDRRWKRAGDVMLIVCGSYVGFMEREVLGHRSPLFGRRTAQILLRPFGYREASEFHPRWSTVERARAYFVCGGVPMYLLAFEPGASVEVNLQRTILDEYGPLHREPDFLLREELREVESYYAVLLAVASGFTTQRDIANETGLPQRSLHYYLGQLEELGYVGRQRPLTGGRKSRRTVRYLLEDPLLRFWFRFVFPNQSYIAHMGAERAFRDRVAPVLDAYLGGCFERFCREALPALYAREGITASFEIGQYWDKQVQIDVVGTRDDGWIDLGECKWGTVRSAKALASELDAKVGRFPNPENATIERRFFLRRRPSRGVPAVGRWHDLDDLYDA